MFATGVTVGMAEWIIDDTCLVKIYFSLSRSYVHTSEFGDNAQDCFLIRKGITFNKNF